MASKVEDALGDLYRYIAHDYQDEEDYVEDETLEQFLFAVMEAVKEAARAEGAEQERARIRRECMGPIYDGSRVVTTMPDVPLYLVPVDVVRPPASVLAPDPKEEGK